MDQKTWLWRKRSSEKTIVANDKADFSVKGNGPENDINENESALVKSVENLNKKLASLRWECDAKDDLVANHARKAQEAIAGREKVETEVIYLKKELDKASQQKVAANERLTNVSAALKDCMQLLSSVREEQEQRIHDAVLKTSNDFEKARKTLEEELSEKCKRLASLTVENSHLSVALLVKEKSIGDLSRCKSQAEAELNTLIARLDSTEKENDFLKYEYHVLEKELEIRNEEIEFSRGSADASHKQHVESVKKIAKLEKECQRLRVLVQKRLPGPVAMAKMRSEVETQGRSQIETRRRKTGGLVVRDSIAEGSHEIPNKKISFLIDHICNVEEENRVLKEVLTNKESELCSSMNVCAQTASMLSQVEAQLAELSKAQKSKQLDLTDIVSNELSLGSYDVGKDEKIMHSESWDPALSSELENFGHGNPRKMCESKMMGVSDMSLMDDFVEMEKLAIVSVDAQLGNSYASDDVSLVLSDSVTKESCMDSTCKELVPVAQADSNDLERELQNRNVSYGKSYDWLQDILKLILEQSYSSNRSCDELLEEIRIAFHHTNPEDANDSYRAGSLKDPEPSEPLPISGYIAWKSPNTSPRAGSNTETLNIGALVEETNNEHIHSNLNRSDEFHESEERSSFLPLAPTSNVQNSMLEQEMVQINVQEENEALKDKLQDMKTLQKDLEARLQLANEKSAALKNQLDESQKMTGNLQIEVETLRELKRLIEDQFENQKLINEDLDTQLNVSKVKLNEILQKLCSAEVELEDRSQCCEELEETCIELQLQLQSNPNKEAPEDDLDREEKLLQTGWEITSASAKLAECQETILNLGKQLESLASPKETTVFNKVFSTSTQNKKLNQRLSLRDRILVDDFAKTDGLETPMIKEIISTAGIKQPATHALVPIAPAQAYIEWRSESQNDGAGALSIVPSKKRGGRLSFLRKLLLRRKRGSSRKTPIPLAT